MSLTTSLTHYYKLDGNTDDSVSGGIDATSDTSTDTSSGKINNGVITGVGNYIDYTNSNTFDPNGGDFSVSIWIKGITDYGMVIAKNDDNNDGWYIYITGGKARFNCEDSGNYVRATGTTTVTDGNWHHIIGTYKASSGIVKIYTDGVYEATATNSLTTDPSDSTAVFSIGSRAFSGSRIEYVGTIDEVGIWQKLLTGQPTNIGDTATGEVSDLYNQGRGTTYDSTNAEFIDPDTEEPLAINLVSYYKFDGDATDSVGSNDGTVTGAINSASYGKINQGYYFDGTDDKIIISDDISLNFGATDDFTISLWIKFTDNTGVYNPLLGKRAYRNEEGYRLFYYGDIYNYLEFTIEQADNTASTVTSDTDLDNNVWYHIVIVRNAGTDLRIYVDGILDCTPASDTTTATLTNTANFEIGYDSSSTSPSYHKGNIDEPAIWSRALTSTEVSDLYNSGSGLQYPFTSSSGWTGKINGKTNPSKVNGIVVANISKVNGVA